MRSKRKGGFTLIELVMVIVILGILAAVAIPMYIDYQQEAEIAAERGVVGGVRAGIMTYYMQKDGSGNPIVAYPSTLDSASTGACTSGNACFGRVLVQGGITDGWTKDTATTYSGPASNTYTYTSASGSFQ